MKLPLPGEPHLSYCTNIHPGESWAQIRDNLGTFLPQAKAKLSPDSPFGVGLRLSGVGADALRTPDALEEFKSFLARHDLYVFTLNAFPYGPFHGQRVKEEVYQPDWTFPERLRFTDLAADLLADLLPDGLGGSISTVPGTFGELARPAAVEEIARNYVRHAAHLVDIERRTGKPIALAIEPEPACMLETTEGAVTFFKDRLFGREARQMMGELVGLADGQAEAALRRHLGLCFDTCHAAVEFEDPQESVQMLDSAGVGITKLQITSALAIPEISEDNIELVRRFDEGIYLHQTVEKRNGRLTRYVDLPRALDALSAGRAGGEWRIHCHVPIFVDQYGELGSTRPFLDEILRLCRKRCVSPHLEAETYTWDVLPPDLRGENKATAIVRELAWARSRLLD